MNRLYPVAAILLILPILSLAAGGTLLSSQVHRQLKRQAEKVFAFDRAHPHQLPAHRLRALSLAEAFHDDDGMRQLLGELEPKINL